MWDGWRKTSSVSVTRTATKYSVPSPSVLDILPADVRGGLLHVHEPSPRS